MPTSESRLDWIRVQDPKIFGHLDLGHVKAAETNQDSAAKHSHKYKNAERV